ncbi:MAG: tRNA pseudouridine(38-40) synthase TruA, partial [Actinobacteria bacterium]|nr:tRNA pseudouridine(38-40) synthase TruA [Actinomycetota bacterium]NIV55766.1 tRNA pseudouridine(38-40) synthase TruA [Actinomycetota bacterium]NIX20723.1 tRNA pseudouridine(38-40) synthase TruA [Actinomycetota bacterium]
MPTYRIDLGYDGSGFHGYARNPGVRTVQGELESALATVLGAEVATTVAGRTDAGVHAHGQVVSFEAAEFDLDGTTRSLRSLLGPEIAVWELAIAPEDFDARFSATSRSYRYLVGETVALDPMLRHTVWHVGVVLDLDAMNAAAAAFVGEHDFASLCRAQKGKTTVRTVRQAVWSRGDDLLRYDVTAAAFCHQMVRSMVALCVEVGRGRVEAERVPAI